MPSSKVNKNNKVESTFLTLDEGKAYYHTCCNTLNFKIRSKGYDSVKKREVFICHRAGVYQSKSCGSRNNTSTIRTGCTYKVVLRQNRRGDSLMRSAVVNDHNHPLDYRVQVPLTAEEVQTLANSRNESRRCFWSLINWSGLEVCFHNIHRIVKWK
jgi:FAR1 DNA-binding domain